MNIEKLRVGDWVEITEPDDFAGYTGQVKIINAVTGYITVSIPNMHYVDVLVDDLQPIPLTAEILEKNGFVETDKDKVKETTTHVFLYVEDGEQEDGFAICGNDANGYYLGTYFNQYPVFVGKYKASKDSNLMSYVYPVYNVKYIHKLQHILKDFEIEKEIIL